MKKIKEGDLVYHTGDKLHEFPYVVKSIELHCKNDRKKIYKAIVNPILNGRIDNTVTVLYFDSSINKVECVHARSTKLITEQIMYNMTYRTALDVQWSYAAWKNILNGFEKGIDIVRLNDAMGNIIFVKITDCHQVTIPNCNDRKDNVHSWVPRIRITIDKLL